MDGITVLVESDGEPDPFLIETRLANKDIEIRCVYVDAANAAGLLATLRAEKGGILVLGSRALLHQLPDAILRETEMPLLLLGR